MTTSSEYFDTPEIRQKIETIRNYLWKFDKNMDDEIDKAEMLAFFDSNMPMDRQYDRQLADKIFAIFDSDHSGKISVDEFIKTFIHIEEELKSHRTQVLSKLKAEKARSYEINKKTESYKLEKINNEGISDSAVLRCIITSIDFTSSNQEIDERISVRLKFEDQTDETEENYVNNQIIDINETFEFKVQRRQPLNFEVLNRKSNREKVAIGSVMLDLNQIMQQDEYEVLLEIPEENNANIISTIHTKITFIWSFYKFYEDQYTKSQKNIKAYESLLEKTTTLLNNLNEPFKLSLFDNLHSSTEMMMRDTSRSGLMKEKAKPEKQLEPSSNDFFNKAEGFIRKHANITDESPKLKKQIVIIILLLMVINFFNSVVYTDMLNMAVPLIILLGVKLGQPDFKWTFALSNCLILFDVLYLLLCQDSPKSEGSYLKFLFFLNIVGFLAKVIMTVLLIVIKGKEGRASD